MQGNGPLSRKKKVSGTADESAMNTSGQGRGEGPVGDKEGYQARRDQQNGASAQRGGANPFSASARPQGQSQPVNRPIARPKTTSGQASGSMNTSGPGMSAGQPQQQRPVSGQFASSRPYQAQQAQRPEQTQSASSAQRASSGRKSGGSMLLIVAVLAVLLLGGGGLGGLFGGGGNDQSASQSGLTTTGGQNAGGSLLGELLEGLGNDTATAAPTARPKATATPKRATATPKTRATATPKAQATKKPSAYGQNETTSALLQQILSGTWYGGQTGQSAASSSQTQTTTAAAVSADGLNRSVAAGSRAKYTSVLGGGKDTVTVMVYMCGADLESRSAMGTKDLIEMSKADLGSNVRLIVYTGGSTQWKNDVISSRVNQIWQITGGKMKCLNENAGTASMTNPETLTSFIQYCAKNFKANRYALILWDHGSGSVSGYGYDEKNPRSGSMSLAGLNSAFQNGGVKFDFIGFDACLMATVENALMASKYADYLIASEETEPGIGWYYTDWLTAWGKNPSLSTLEIGKQICDDFVSHCAASCRGQQTTLSVIDLAEIEHTVPDKLTAFSKSVSSMISNKEYKAVSSARNGSREFAVSSRIDQVDLADLCDNLNTKESAALAKALRSAVKYNKINNISDAYGLSIYFPYKKVSNVDKAVKTYAAIGMDDSYAQAIRDFAGMEASGQAVTGGSTSAMPSLFGTPSGQSSSYGSSSDMIEELLSAFLGGGYGRISGLSGENTGFLSGRAMSDSEVALYLSENMLDADSLCFVQDGEQWVLSLEPQQWALVTGADQNVFYDNGKGYVDLGLDNLFTFDEQGRMVADMDNTWLALNGQPVPYYHETSQYLENGGWIITGRVPVLLNDSRADLLIVFDNEHEDGYVAGARSVYGDETETVAKSMTEIADGDRIVLLADLYDYEQNYTDSYVFGNPITVQGELAVSNVYLPDASKVSVTYRITDIYNQAYWTPVIGR